MLCFHRLLVVFCEREADSHAVDQYRSSITDRTSLSSQLRMLQPSLFTYASVPLSLSISPYASILLLLSVRLPVCMLGVRECCCVCDSAGKEESSSSSSTPLPPLSPSL